MEIRFSKYEGAGNDFILLDGRGGPEGLPARLIAAMCDRHRGVGGDGLMILQEEEGYDFRMKYYNADGGEVDMCGNGARCISLFADHLGIGGDLKRFIGRDGVHTSRMIQRNRNTATIETKLIDVGRYVYSDSSFFMNTGVPHFVEFVDNVDEVDVFRRGRIVRYDDKYARDGGTNANFVEILRHGHIKVRTYERGVEGETLACGTGAAASAIATHIYAQGDCRNYTVDVPGGQVFVAFESEDNQHFTNIRLSGPARFAFSGTLDEDNFML